MSLETLCCRSSVEGQSSEPSGPTFFPSPDEGRRGKVTSFWTAWQGFLEGSSLPKNNCILLWEWNETQQSHICCEIQHGEPSRTIAKESAIILSKWIWLSHIMKSPCVYWLFSECHWVYYRLFQAMTRTQNR